MYQSIKKDKQSIDGRWGFVPRVVGPPWEQGAGFCFLFLGLSFFLSVLFPVPFPPVSGWGLGGWGEQGRWPPFVWSMGSFFVVASSLTFVCFLSFFFLLFFRFFSVSLSSVFSFSPFSFFLAWSFYFFFFFFVFFPRGIIRFRFVAGTSSFPSFW